MAKPPAACYGTDPELFFPIGTGVPALIQAERARAVCLRCPIIESCLEQALTEGIDYGVWGGKTEMERRVLTRTRFIERRINGDHRNRTALVKAMADQA